MCLLAWPSVCLLWRNVHLGLLPIFQLGCLVCFWVIWAVCTFWRVKPLTVKSFVNIFSHPLVVFSFLLLSMVSFAVQKFVSLIRYHLFIFLFISVALGDWPKKTLPQFISENVLPMFSSRTFTVSYLIFKSLNHSEFIRMYSKRVCFNFIGLHAAVQFPQHRLLQRMSLAHCLFLYPLSLC